MIIMIEGARGSGKSHLVNQFFKQNERKDIIYYKFALSDLTKLLKFEDQETGPGLHYFSISNIITILGISQTLLRDKHIVFDRSIYSAYVWSIFRRRMNTDRLLEEFNAYLSSPEYHNVAVIDIMKAPGSGKTRDKDDIFDKFENYEVERAIYEKVYDAVNVNMVDASRNNIAYSLVNRFDEDSERDFNDLLYSAIDK